MPAAVAAGSPTAPGAIGSGAHLLGEQLRQVTQLNWEQVPYKNGETGILIDLVGGQIDVGFMGAGSAKTHAAAGKVKILAVTGSRRTPQLPDVPTFSEQGLQGMEYGGWIAALRAGRNRRARWSTSWCPACARRCASPTLPNGWKS